MPFGQLVIGPPGSGKTTYCNGMQQFLQLLDRRVAVVNLDPANDALPYECAVDVRDLISLEEVQDQEGLGPNGGLVFCMDYIESNLDWLREQLEPLIAEDCYLLFDCPGQVELFTLHDALNKILKVMTNDWHLRLTAVHLVDAHLTSDPGKYLAAMLLSLSTMLHLGLPHINVLSKVDLVSQYGRPAFGLEYYAAAKDLGQLADLMAGGSSGSGDGAGGPSGGSGGPSGEAGDSGRQSATSTAFPPRFRRLTSALCEVVEDFSLLRFIPLHVEDKHSMAALLRHIDKGNGHAFTGRPDTEALAQFSPIATADYDAADMAADFEERFMPSTISERH